MAFVLPIVVLYFVMILAIEMAYGWVFRLYEYTKGFVFPTYKIKSSVKMEPNIPKYWKLRKLRTRNMILNFSKSLVTLVLIGSFLNEYYVSKTNPVDKALDNNNSNYYGTIIVGGLIFLILTYIISSILIKPHSDFHERISIKLFLTAIIQWELLLFLRDHAATVLKFRRFSGEVARFDIQYISKFVLLVTAALVGLRIIFWLIYFISPVSLPLTKSPYHIRVWNGKKLVKYKGVQDGPTDRIVLLLHGFAVNYKSWMGKITDDYQEVRPPVYLEDKYDKVFALNFSDYLKNGLLQKSYAFDPNKMKVVNQAVNHYEWELALALSQLVKSCKPSHVHIITHSTSGVVTRSLFTGDNQLLFQNLGISAVNYRLTLLAAPNKGAKGGSSVVLSNLLMMNFNVAAVNTTKSIVKLLPFIRRFVEPLLDYMFGNGLMATLINCQTPVDLHPRSQYIAQLNKNKRISEDGDWLVLFETLLDVKWEVASARFDRVVGSGGNLTFDDIQENDRKGIKIQYANFRADHDNLFWEELEQIGMKVPGIKSSKIVLEWMDNPDIISHSGNQSLNAYKIKSSHNSYSDSALSSEPTSEVTKQLIQNNFRSIELDVTRDLRSRKLIVAHFDDILEREETLADYTDMIASFHKIRAPQDLFDTMFLMFDMKKSDQNTVIEVANTVFKSFNALNEDNTINHSAASQLFVKSSELPPNSEAWPTFSACKNRIILSMHSRPYKNMPDEYRAYFVTDDKFSFSNYGYSKLRMPIISYRKRRALRKDLRHGKIVRVYPPVWNGFFGLFRNAFGMNLDFCIKLNAQMIAVDGRKRKDLNDLFGNHSFLVEYSFKD